MGVLLYMAARLKTVTVKERRLFCDAMLSKDAKNKMDRENQKRRGVVENG